jgi:hypothetical protein
MAIKIVFPVSFCYINHYLFQCNTLPLVCEVTLKKSLSERDICTQYIAPAIVMAGWNLHRQVREEVTFTAGKIIVRDTLHTRGTRKRVTILKETKG